jgi:hypothetical protein
VCQGVGHGSGVIGRGSGVIGRGRSRGRGISCARGVDITDPYPAIDCTSKNQVEWHQMETGCQTSFRHNIEFHSTTEAAFYALKTR